MSMFDKPVYLTGKEGYVTAGDTFWLHNARLNGTVNMPGGKTVDQAKLLVSHERDGEQTVVYTAGAAIVNQIKRMDNSDRSALPMEVRLDTVPSKQGSDTNVITPADQPPPSGGSGTSAVADF